MREEYSLSYNVELHILHIHSDCQEGGIRVKFYVTYTTCPLVHIDSVT